MPAEAYSDAYMRRYSDDERAQLEIDARLWRIGLRESLARAGFVGPDAEREYLESIGVEPDARLLEHDRC